MLASWRVGLLIGLLIALPVIGRALPLVSPAPPVAPATAGAVLKRCLFTVPGDFKNITLAPFRDPNDGLKLLGATAVLVAIDKPTTIFLQNHIQPLLSYQLPALLHNAPFGNGADGYLVVLLPAWYLGSLATGQPHGQATAVLALKASAYAVLYTQVLLKSVTGRIRPADQLSGSAPAPDGYTKDPLDWGHLHAPEWGAALEATSFPSFHYTLYASVARVYAKMYHNNWLPYGIAALLMGSDFKGHHHWVSDAVVGSIVGTEIGNVVVDNYQGVTPPTAPSPSSPPPATPTASGWRCRLRGRSGHWSLGMVG